MTVAGTRVARLELRGSRESENRPAAQHSRGLVCERRRVAATVASVGTILRDIVHDLIQRVAVQSGGVARLAGAERGCGLRGAC